MHNHSYENEFNLHVNEFSFSDERMSTKTRFEKEATGNSEMAYLVIQILVNTFDRLEGSRSPLVHFLLSSNKKTF